MRPGKSIGRAIALTYHQDQDQYDDYEEDVDQGSEVDEKVFVWQVGEVAAAAHGSFLILGGVMLLNDVRYVGSAFRWR